MPVIICIIFHLLIRGEAPCEQILTKFCEFGDIPNAIICANFGVEKLRGLGKTGVKVWALPLKRLVTLTIVLRYRTAGDAQRMYQHACGRRMLSHTYFENIELLKISLSQ